MTFEKLPLPDPISYLSKSDLHHLLVPENLYMFYEAKDILKIGKKLASGVYLLDNFIFLIDPTSKKITRCYHAVSVLLQNISLLTRSQVSS